MSDHLYAVDPGVHACGVALFVDRQLYACALVPAADGPLPARALFTFRPPVVSSVTRCACEKPKVYPHGKAKKGRDVRPGDLIDLAIAAGRMTGMLTTKYLEPAEWKGQLPKKIHHERVGRALTEPEHVVLAEHLRPIKTALQHNVLDAVALGLRTLGRI